MPLHLTDLLRHKPALIAFVGFCGALVIHLFEVAQGIGNTLEGPHDFRQSQTALTTYYLQRSGLTADYETPVFGSPASIPFEFPTYQFAVVGVQKLLGCRLDVAGRITSIIFFYATLPLIVFTLRRLRLPWAGIWLGLAALLVSPVYIFYTRAFLIESTTLFASWMFLLCLSVLLFREPSATDEADEGRVRRIFLLLALAAGMLAAVTKVTTFAVHAAGAVWLWLAFHRKRLRLLANDAGVRRGLRNDAVCLGVIFAGILAVVAWWTHRTDVAKLSNPSPIVHRLTSTALTDWNFGYSGQWAKPGTWRGLYNHFLSASVASFFPVGLAVIFFSMLHRHRTVIIALGLTFLTGPALFTNLFFVHDYYWYANTVFLSLACGITVGTFLLESLASLKVTRLLLVAVFILAQAAAYHYSGYHLLQKVPPQETVRLTETLRQHTARGSSIVVFGFDWNSMIPYYSERRAFMVPWDNELFFDDGSQQAIANMVAAGHPVGAVVFGGATATDAVLQNRVLGTLPGHFLHAQRLDGALILLRDPAHAGDTNTPAKDL